VRVAKIALCAILFQAWLVTFWLNPTTTGSINRVQKFWIRYGKDDPSSRQRLIVYSFCSFMGVDSESHLGACLPQNFRLYADWRLANFKVKKQSTIWVEWKFLRLLYRRETGRKIDELVGEEISEVSCRHVSSYIFVLD
jgi:hypothetical protein